MTKMEIGEVRFHFTTPLRTLFEGGLGGRGFELTTSRVDFPSYSTVLAQIRKVGFFLAKMKICELRFHFTTLKNTQMYSITLRNAQQVPAVLTNV